MTCCRPADIVRGFVENVWNSRDETAIDQYMHPDVLVHRLVGYDISSAIDFRECVHRPLMEAFSDLLLEIDDLLEQVDQVVFRWHATATYHPGEFGIPAHGGPITAQGITWVVCRDGKMAELWDGWDQAGLFRRICAADPTRQTAGAGAIFGDRP